MAQKPRRNASIVITVLILMVVSSFLVLLTMRYLLSMISGFTSLTNYYKTYYIARGSMDVMLTQHAYRGRWYQTQFSGWVQDFACSSMGCNVQGSIQSRFDRTDMSNSPQWIQCDPNQALLISGWQSMIFALFADAYQWPYTFQPVSTGTDYQAFTPGIADIEMTLYDNPTTGQLYLYDAREWDFGYTTGIQSIPGDFWSPIGWVYTQHVFTTQQSKPWRFLIVSNPEWASAFRFCFSSPSHNMVGLTSIIHVDASFADAAVSLETIKMNRFPSILLQ
jgi:hypothetical protein